MSKISYTYIPFTKATIVDRRHRRDIVPPGMIDVQNFLPSRSDSTPVLRPDLWYTQDAVFGMSTYLTLPSTSTIRDVLNSANGLYGSSQVTYFTTYVPFGNYNGDWRVLSGTHNDGTCSGASGQSFVTGSGTTFLQNAHRGAIMRVLAYDGGSITGSLYEFYSSASAVNDEYYMTGPSAADPSLLGNFLVRYYYYGNSGFGIQPSQGTVGSLSDGEVGFGDNDTLGFSTVYLKNTERSPENDVADNGLIANVYTGVDISGAVHEWVTSGAGTNEYYVRARTGGGSAPGIVGDAVDDLQAGGYYTKYGTLHSKNSVYFTVSEALDGGTAGSLSEYEIDVAQDPGASYDTLHIRDNNGDPDTTSGSAYQPGRVRAYLTKDYTGASYKWTPSAAQGEYVFYLEAAAGGDPGIYSPNIVYFDGVAGTQDQSPDSNNEWAYGDFESGAGLGYDTLYVYQTDGNPDATGVTILGSHLHVFDGSPYKWTQVGATNEWYLELAAGGDPSISEPNFVMFQASQRGKGVVGSLGSNSWGWGQDPGATYNTIYVYSTTDPNAYSVSTSTGMYLAASISAVYVYSIYTSPYTWSASGSGTNEYYAQLNGAAGGDPSISSPGGVYVGGTAATEGTLGSLSDGEWAYGDNDGLGFDTVYLRNDTQDPDGVAGTGTVSITTSPLSINVDSDGDIFDYYLVDRITSDTSLSVYGEIENSFSNVQPQFYYNHNPFLSDYKLNIQAYTSGLIYNGPTIRDNIDEEDICGPFYADLQDGEWAYDGRVLVDYDFRGTGVVFEYQNLLATNGSSYVEIFPDYRSLLQGSNTFLGNGFFLALSYGLANNAWDKKYWNVWTDHPDAEEDATNTVTINGDGVCMLPSSIQVNPEGKYICSASCYQTAVGGDFDGDVYPGIAVSSTGLTWTLYTDTAYGPWTNSKKATTDYQSISAAASSTRVVVLHWRNSDNRIVVRYSDDSGVTWNDVAIDGGNTYFAGGSSAPYCKVQYIGGQFIINKLSGVLYGDGSTFTTKVVSASASIVDVATDGDGTWVAVDASFRVWRSTSLSGTWESITLPLGTTFYGETTNHIHYDRIGKRFIVNSVGTAQWSEDGEDWAGNFTGTYGDTGSQKNPTNIISDSAGVFWTLYDGGADRFRQAALSRFSYSYWDVIDFVPVSDIYRSSTFSVLDGYVVLCGTREYDDTSEEWTYYPRRIRWTAPATYNDFTSTGTGTADLNGEGAILDSRPVNGRIVLFETNRVSSIVPRGDVEDPWDYDVIKEDFRILSNPVTVDDQCYVIGTDGLLYATDGINVIEVGSSFDATRFDDFAETKPIILDYSRQFNSLFSYRFDADDSEHYCYFISLSDGCVSRVLLSEIVDSVQTLANKPAFITSVSESSDQSVIVSHHPRADDDDFIVTKRFATEKPIVGQDRPTYLNYYNDASYWYGTLETGELFLAPEGSKTNIRHVIVRTYSGVVDGTNTDRPRIIVLFRSLEDDDWHVARQDVSGTNVTMTSSAFTGTYTAWSTKIATGDDAETTYYLPVGDENSTHFVDGRTANVYLEESGTYTLQTYGTDYTVPTASTPNKIVFATAPTSSQTIYYSWNNKPEVMVEAGDFFLAPDSYHRVTSITDNDTAVLEHYAPSGTTYSWSNGDSIEHFPSVQIPDGDGEVKFGVNKLVEGVRIKIIVIPEYNSSAASTTVKVTGISIGHIPMGRKILQATGS